MGNKELDNYLRDLLGDFKSEGEPSHWEEFAQQLDIRKDQADGSEQLDDQILKDKLSNYTPEGQVTGWDRIESSLNASENEFDAQVRERIKEFHPPKDPHSWPVFQQHFSAHKLLRAKLVALKIFETAAMVLLLVTIFHMGHLGKLPFLSSPAEDLALNDSVKNPLNGDIKTNKDALNGNATRTTPVEKPSSLTSPQAPSKLNVILPATSLASGLTTEVVTEHLTSAKDEPSHASFSFPVIPQEDVFDTAPSSPSKEEVEPTIMSSQIGLPAQDYSTNAHKEVKAVSPIVNENYIPPSLPLQKSNFSYTKANPVPDPVFVKTIEKTFLEFGMLAQVDYNQLKLPEDRLYNNGKQVVFPLQGLTSPGYGAGFTLAVAHSRWAIETGLVYSSKTFSPGRKLTVGEGIENNSNVEFDAMHMQLVSVPLQYRYRFEPKGRLKAYALAGFGLNLIARSDIDILVEYNFPSLPEGENPNTNPSLARTIRETKRVSDGFREKAPFRNQSFISADLGLGLEYQLAERKTLFLQTAYQYQIPNLRFSNHNGKHLLTLSIQAGIRTPLGS